MKMKSAFSILVSLVLIKDITVAEQNVGIQDENSGDIKPQVLCYLLYKYLLAFLIFEYSYIHNTSLFIYLYDKVRQPRKICIIFKFSSCVLAKIVENNAGYKWEKGHKLKLWEIKLEI